MTAKKTPNSKPVFKSAVKKVSSKPKPAKKAAIRPFNHIALIVDRSSSMGGLRHDVVNIFNSQVKTIKEKSLSENQDTRVSYYTFSSVADKPVFFDNDVHSLRDISLDDYRPEGMTAMLDAVGSAVMDLKKLSYAKDPNVSFLLIVITDGEENQSKNFNAKNLRDLLDEVQKTDRWSVAFMVPPGAAAHASKQFNIALGNFQEWEATSQGVKQAGVAMGQALGGYYSSRSAGKSSTQGFFSTDLSKVKPQDLKKSMQDVSFQFKKWMVDKETPIKDFVEGHGHQYEIGKAYYELTKKEEVQANKDIVIMDKTSGAVYAGNQARNVIGIPNGNQGTVKVAPGNHMLYSVFILSTSTNRKLVRGTTLLYAK